MLNWFAAHPAEHPVRVAFWELMGPHWRNLPVDSWVLACRILDCAFSVITKGNERGWL